MPASRTSPRRANSGNIVSGHHHKSHRASNCLSAVPSISAISTVGKARLKIPRLPSKSGPRPSKGSHDRWSLILRESQLQQRTHVSSCIDPGRCDAGGLDDHVALVGQVDRGCAVSALRSTQSHCLCPVFGFPRPVNSLLRSPASRCGRQA